MKIMRKYVLEYQLNGKLYRKVVDNELSHVHLDVLRKYVKTVIHPNAIWCSLLPVEYVLNDNI